jgi:hypothetical protein
MAKIDNNMKQWYETLFENQGENTTMNLFPKVKLASVMETGN